MPRNPYDQFAHIPEPPRGAQANPYDQFDPPAPTAVPVAPAAPQQAENQYSLKNLVGAAVEPIMSLISGAIAGPVSGFAGMAGTAIPGPKGQGAAWTQGVGQALTYEPRTQGGRTALGAIAYPFEKVAEGADWAGERVSEVAGPAAGAGVNAALQVAAPGAMIKGMRGFPARGQIDKPPVQLLADKGVTMTPGQISGGLLGRIEQKVQSVPILGDAIREAKVKGVEQFNRAAINDALKPVGKKLPEGIKGNAAIEWASDALGSAYEALLPSLSLTVPRPVKNTARELGKFGDEPPQKSFAPPSPESLPGRLEQVRQSGANLAPEQRTQLGSIIDKEVLSRADANGVLDGKTLKNIESKLTSMDKVMRRSENYAVRELGMRVQDVRSALRDMIAEANPTHAAALSKINDGYAKFKIAQRAATSTAAKEGVFTPTQYHSAVKAKDVSKDKARFAEGTAKQQELSKAGKFVLPDVVADSGTADRILLAEMMRKPWLLPPAWAASLLYSQPSLRGMQGLMLRPPRMGHAATRALPYGGLQQGQIPEPPQ